MAYDNGVHFPTVGRQFIEARQIMNHRVGNADSMLFPTRELVDFARSYFLRALG